MNDQDADITIQGLEEAQAANVKLMNDLKPGGRFGGLIRNILLALHGFMVTITHRLSGALAASERMEHSGLQGRIFIDPGALNPTGQRPADYGPIENARGGDHAFLDRTVDMAPKVVQPGVHAFLNR